MKNEILFALLRLSLSAIMTVLMYYALVLENMVAAVIVMIIVVPLLLVLIYFMTWLMLGDFVNSIAETNSWRYIRDERYHGFSIQNQKRLFGITWWTNEYISGSEAEAERLVNLKNVNF